MKKKTILSFCIFAFACVMSACLVSCGGDDDDPTPTPTPTPDQKKATTVTLTAEYYTTTKTLNYFNVTVTDPDGNIIELTADNTAKVTVTDDGNESVDLKQLNRYAEKYSDELRVYKLNAQTFTSFPKNFNLTITAKPKDVTPAEGESIVCLLQPMASAVNDVKVFEYYKHGNSIASPFVFSASKWPEIIEKYSQKGISRHIECKLQSASYVVLSNKF